MKNLIPQFSRTRVGFFLPALALFVSAGRTLQMTRRNAFPRYFSKAIQLAAWLMLLALLQAVTNAQSFSAPSSYESFENPTFAVAADFDGDGKMDLATANALTDSVTFAFNNGTGSFPSTIYCNSDPNPGWAGPQPLAIGDFNGDGKPDVAVGNSTGGTLSQGSIGILLNNGNRTLRLPCPTTPVVRGTLRLLM